MLLLKLQARWCSFMMAGVLVLTAAAGCGGPDGPELFEVKGNVTYEGTPVETGRITFRKKDSDQKAYSAEITAGAYTMQCEAGPCSVEITASRIIPGKFDTSNPDDEPQPVGEMYIPAKYNSKTQLLADVAPSGENTVDFALTEK
ncbi:MAG: hypothetical protein KDA85_00230 [Planctomycetaceae bacterium]|nr:hypothetical protein [Planctomycetaceae bacterium]